MAIIAAIPFESELHLSIGNDVTASLFHVPSSQDVNMVECDAGHDRHDSDREIPLVLSNRKGQRPLAVPRLGSVTVSVVCNPTGCRIAGRSDFAESSSHRKVPTNR